MTEEEKDRILTIADGLYYNQLMLETYKNGMPEPQWLKFKNGGINETRLSS